MNKEASQKELHRRLGSLFGVSLQLSAPVSQLHLIREKMAQRGYQHFDKEDLLSALGNLQHAAIVLHSEMLGIEGLLKKLED